MDWIGVLTALAALAAAVYTARAAKAARDGLNRDARPLLLDARAFWSNDPEHFPLAQRAGWVDAIRVNPSAGTGRVPIRNVATGVAVVNSYGIALTNRPDEAHWQGSTEAIPGGEQIELPLEPEGDSAFVRRLQEVPSPLHEANPLVVFVQYTDLDGKQPQTLELTLRGAPNSDATYLVAGRHRRDGYVVEDI